VIDHDIERDTMRQGEEEQRERGLSQEEGRRAARCAFEALSLLPRIPNLRLFTSHELVIRTVTLLEESG
jgi:hypothetical protein